MSVIYTRSFMKEVTYLDKLRIVGLCMFFGAILLAVVSIAYGAIKSAMER